MRCELLRDRIGMLLDGELPADERDAVSAHAADCPKCGRYRDDLLRLRRYLVHVREPAPARLAQRVSSRLAVEATRTEPDEDALPVKVGVLPRSGAWLAFRLAPYARYAAVVLIACAVSMAGTLWWAQRTDTQARLSRDLLGAHVRALIQDSPVQVASRDTHTVKPWFAGRLDYSPMVKDLAAEGFQLVGGRLDYIDGRRVAALVYRRRLHQISVFIWPSDNRPVPSYSARIDGYSVLGWSKANMTYWAVSDVGEGDLRELEALL
jgi:anti-sigma factor RsiW